MKAILLDEAKKWLEENCENQYTRMAVYGIMQSMPTVDYQETPNEPLTLEQLRQRGGKPVWIVEHPDWGHWELSDDGEDYIADRDPELYGLRHNDPEGKFGLHKLGWLAYAYPPFHIDREAWTAEWEEDGECDHKPYRIRDTEKWKKYKCSKCGYKAGRRTRQKYCPSCGRAMTPEAWAELEKRIGGAV